MKTPALRSPEQPAEATDTESHSADWLLSVGHACSAPGTVPLCNLRLVSDPDGRGNELHLCRLIPSVQHLGKGAFQKFPRTFPQ